MFISQNQEVIRGILGVAGAKSNVYYFWNRTHLYFSLPRRYQSKTTCNPICGFLLPHCRTEVSTEESQKRTIRSLIGKTNRKLLDTPVPQAMLNTIWSKGLSRKAVTVPCTEVTTTRHSFLPSAISGPLEIRIISIVTPSSSSTANGVKAFRFLCFHRGVELEYSYLSVPHDIASVATDTRFAELCQSHHISHAAHRSIE